MKKGVLLVGWGAPEYLDPESIKIFLNEILMDPMVVDRPVTMRRFMANRAIRKLDPEKLSEQYRRIRYPNGAPQISIMKLLQSKIRQRTHLPIEIGFRYHKRFSIYNGLAELEKKEVDSVLIILMYPQYTQSSTWSAVNMCNWVHREYFPNMKLSYMTSFYNHPEFTDVLGNYLLEFLPLEYDKLLFSFQGIPKKHERLKPKKQADAETRQLVPYHQQCLETAEMLRKVLHLEKDRIIVSFQSPFDKKGWLGPRTEDVLKELPSQGVKNLAVVSPSYVTDNFETLWRLKTRGEEIFKENGGELYTFIPAMNDSQIWLELLDHWTDDWASKIDKK